jgi:MoaA/NifB/PqqE/SkfB family radical SAM enzyme
LFTCHRHSGLCSPRPGVRLATSYYADNAKQHEATTKGRGSYTRTRANIAEALRRSIPLRVGVIDVVRGQRVDEARRELADLGVLGEVRVDHLRQVGRGVREPSPNVGQLCGNCTRGTVAVSPAGDVWPCVFARWLPVGNVRQETLAEIITGPRMIETMASLAESFAGAVDHGVVRPAVWAELRAGVSPAMLANG